MTVSSLPEVSEEPQATSRPAAQLPLCSVQQGRQGRRTPAQCALCLAASRGKLVI